MSNTSNQSGVLSSCVYLQKYTLFILYYLSPKIASIYPNAFLNYMSTQASRRCQGYPPNYRDQISRDHLPPTHSHLPRATPLDFTWSPSVISRSPLRKQAKISLSCQARRKILVRIQAADQPRAPIHTAVDLHIPGCNSICTLNKIMATQTICTNPILENSSHQFI